jgi:DNA-3-methyladenine glycosylase II
MTRSPDSIEFVVTPHPPFRLDLTAWTLRRRPVNRLDRWDGETYRRVLRLVSGQAEMAVISTGRSEESPSLYVKVTGDRLDPGAEETVRRLLGWSLGLNEDLQGFYETARMDSTLGALAERFRGVKPPRFHSVFEALVNGIACQQLSLTVCIHIVNRIVETYGAGLSGGDGAFHAFPRPEDVVDVEEERLRAVGITHHKARSLAGIARAAVEGSLDIEDLAALPNEHVVQRLRQLRGIGPWTADYVLLRGLGRLDVFPAGDVGARNGLRKLAGLETLGEGELDEVLLRWRPYRGLVYFHLLLKQLAEEGHIS